MTSYPMAIIAKNISIELPEGRILFENFNFTLENNITALVGPNGVGKSVGGN